MKRKILIILLMSINSILYSQIDLIWSDEVETDFSFGYSQKEFPHLKVENNIIKVLGISDTNNDNKLQLIEYSLDGDILNTQFYGIDPAKDDRVVHYKVDAGGNLYLIKHILLANDFVSLMIQKFDIDANLIWEEEYPATSNFSYLGDSIEILNGGQIFIAVDEVDATTGEHNQLVISYNSSGTFLWQINLPEIEFFTSDVTNYDNNVIVFGFNDYPVHSMITIEVDGTKTVIGNIEFIRGLYDISIDENLNIFATHSSLYWLTKLNSQGVVIWSTLYDDLILGMGLERITAFIKDDQENIFITGHFPGGDTGDPNDRYLDILTLKLNVDGEILWENRYHRNIDSGEASYDIKLKNGFIYVGGQSSRNGIGSDHDFVVLKMNANNGQETTIYRYNNNDNYDDCIYSLEVLDTDEVVLTGLSGVEFGSNVNLITQKLSGVTGTLSIPEKEQDLIILFPNPLKSNGVLTIKNNRFTEYKILSISGKIISKGKLTSKKNSEIYLGNLSSGIYLFALESAKEFITKKLIIE